MSVIVLLVAGIIAFFAFFSFMGRMQKAGSMPIAMASPQLAVRRGPDATRIGIAALLAQVDVRAGQASPKQLVVLLPALGASRGFPEGFWHAEDEAAAVDVMGARFEEMGLELFTTAELKKLISDVPRALGDVEHTESLHRRAQIETVLRQANHRLEASPDLYHARRFRQFAEDLPGWDPDEPAWLLCDPAEEQMLLEADIVRPLR